jgi:hypothetical protein
MPMFAMDSQKVLNGEFWTNRYMIEATDLATATTAAAFIRDKERNVHSTIVTFDKYRVSDTVVGTDVYQVVNDNVQGTRAAPNGEWMPLFCVLRVDFNTVGGGRPSRKYLRLPLYEDDCYQGNTAQAIRTLVLTSYAGPLIGLANFVDVDGQAFSSASASLAVGMRQLRRGSKRRALPIIV